MVSRQERTRPATRDGDAGEMVQLVRQIDQKLGYLIEQLRKDLYILVPREHDRVFGGRPRGKRSR